MANSVYVDELCDSYALRFNESSLWIFHLARCASMYNVVTMWWCAHHWHKSSRTGNMLVLQFNKKWPSTSRLTATMTKSKINDVHVMDLMIKYQHYCSIRKWNAISTIVMLFCCGSGECLLLLLFSVIANYLEPAIMSIFIVLVNYCVKLCWCII